MLGCSLMTLVGYFTGRSANAAKIIRFFSYGVVLLIFLKGSGEELSCANFSLSLFFSHTPCVMICLGENAAKELRQSFRDKPECGTLALHNEV
jgi:hypothetical protein